MRRRPVPSPLARCLTALRVAKDWQQGQLARALGIPEKEFTRYENGHRKLSREELERFIAPMGLGPADIDSTLFWLETLGLEVHEIPEPPPGPPFEPTPGERHWISRGAIAMAWKSLRATLSALTRARAIAQAHHARSQAPALWKRLRPFAPGERRVLIEESEEYRSWALAELVSEESARAAADDPARALELAELARYIAERVRGGELWRMRLQGLIWAFVGNARRVASDLRGAEQGFVQARLLWEAGATADPGILDASRLLDLEASLRRDQRHFPEALALLDKALAAAAQNSARAAHILLKAAFTCEQMGDCERAIAALERAAPLIDAERAPRQVWAHRLNLAANLCHLGRYAEAVPIAAEARELAIALRNELDLVRTVWLEQGRLAAGLGRRAQAIAALRQVRVDFADREVPYDAALATLDLAVLLLEEGQTAEVRALAPEMAPIFASLEVHREALAALRLFWSAVEREEATAELGRRLVQFLERARYDPELRFAGLTHVPRTKPVRSR